MGKILEEPKSRSKIWRRELEGKGLRINRNKTEYNIENDFRGREQKLYLVVSCRLGEIPMIEESKFYYLMYKNGMCYKNEMILFLFFFLFRRN